MVEIEGWVLFRLKLEAEREVYRELDVPVLEGQPFTFPSEESYIRTQIGFLLFFRDMEDNFEL